MSTPPDPATLQCYRCGTALARLSLPLSRLDQCPECSVELHVCMMCAHYDPAVTDACREDDAEEVRDKTKANFCDWFRPRPGAFDGSLRAADARAKDELAALFGGAAAADESGSGSATGESDALDRANELFRQ